VDEPLGRFGFDDWRENAIAVPAALALAWLFQQTSLGAMLAPPLTVALTLAYGWRSPFVVIGGLEKTAVTPNTIAAVGRLHLDNNVSLGVVTAVLSNIVSNVPAVLMLKPFVSGLPEPSRAWLLIAMAATFAGNFTLVGSVANLIVARRAENRGVQLGFWPYFKVGAPLTVVTIAIGLLWL